KQQNRFRVLLVDDDPVNLQVLHNYLSPLNYELVEASGGQHALYEIAKSEAFDLILLDLLMPRISGFKVCEKIRELYAVNELPVIFLTANIDVNNLVQCFKVGGNDYLNKPVNKHELLTRVETHLKLSDINRTLERQVIERTAALEEINQKFNTLGKICNEISSTLDLDKLLITVYYRIRELMDIKVLCIGHYEPQNQRIVFRQGIESEMYLPEFQDLMSERNQPAVWCVENKKPVIINDYSRDYAGYFGEVSSPVTKVGVQPKSVMYWPLIVGDRVIGVLTVQSLKKNVYKTPQQDMMKTLASTTAIALDHAKAYSEVGQQKLALEEKNAEIVISQKRLAHSEKMASLGTLTAGVAHEINNPTNFVHVSAQNLSVDLARFETFILELAGTDADESIISTLRNKFEPLHQHLTTISQGTERIKAIVQDLGAYTHFDGDDKEMAKITDCLKSTLNLVQTKYLELADFVTDFRAEPQLQCYPAKLNQVFMNLMVNACDAIRDKRRKQQTPTKGEIVISCDKLENVIHISVKDNGCGIDELTQKKLFEPFYTTKSVGEGTGLGLSISFGIIEGHGGTIEVESIVGVGTKFTILLPVL
ncbi:MAG: response regulator, partial [Algicola sp.]|nr:response regulator [Algicola sp.]